MCGDEDAASQIHPMRTGAGERGGEVKREKLGSKTSPFRGPAGGRLEHGGRRRCRALEQQGLVNVVNPAAAVMKDDGVNTAQSRKSALRIHAQHHSQSSVVSVHFPRAWMQVAPASTRRTPCPKNAPQNTGSASWKPESVCQPMRKHHGPQASWPKYLTYRPEDHLFFDAFTAEQIGTWVRAHGPGDPNPYISGDGGN